MSELYRLIKEIAKVLLRAISNEIRYYTSTTKLDIAANKKIVAIFFAADYCNLGDVAITISQYNYIKATLPDYEIIQFLLKIHLIILGHYCGLISKTY